MPKITFDSKILKRIATFGYWVVAVFLLSIACLTILSTLDLPFKFRFFVVQTGSMEPAIKTGSLVVVQSAPNYKKNDIITFQSLQSKNIKNRKTTITHRVVNVETIDENLLYATKGDANKAADSAKVPNNLILGKVIFSFPYLGYPVNFAKTQMGFILLIVIPATLIVFSELLNIKKEAIRLMKERKQRKLTTTEEIEEKVGEKVIAVEEDLKEILDK